MQASENLHRSGLMQCSNDGDAHVLFDDLIGPREHCRRYCEFKRLCGFEIDDELEARGLKDWQVSRIFALKNTPGIRSRLLRKFGAICAVAHQAAGGDKFAPFVECGNTVSRGECNEPLAHDLKNTPAP